MKPLAHMAPFFSRFPELAARETRTIRLLEPHAALPAGEYGFLELYCNEPTCDCRRVLFQVCRADLPNKVLATINYGWESRSLTLNGCTATARARGGWPAPTGPLNTQSKLSPACWSCFAKLSLRIAPILTVFAVIMECSSARKADQRQS